MKEFSMFYKIRNILLILLSFVLTSVEAKAQGVVSLSEEALFEDELDTEITKKEAAPEIAAEVPAEVSAEVPVISSEKKFPVKKPTPPVIEKKPELDITPQKKPSPFENVIEDTPANITENSNVEYIEPESSDLYNSVDGDVNLKSADVFTHMSDIEKRTAILNLELRREKLQDDIEAIKYKRREAIAKEKQKEEEQRLKNLEAKKEIERKVVEEQTKLRELDLKFEQLRQEKILGAYKNKMLEETQKWIEHDGKFYKQIGELRNNNKRMAENLKTKMSALKEKAKERRDEFVRRVNDYEKRLEDKNAQIDILRSRITNLEKEREAIKKDPFAGFDKAQIAAAAGIDILALDAFISQNQQVSSGAAVNGAEPVENDLSKLYRVTEIRGKGDELIARLVNKNNASFYVKKGTALQSGHIISKITTTFVLAERGADKQYLYFAAGGILPAEVSNTPEETKAESKTPTKK